VWSCVFECVFPDVSEDSDFTINDCITQKRKKYALSKRWELYIQRDYVINRNI
jgi:hypothetical protein